MRQRKTILFGVICLGLMFPGLAIAAEVSNPRELLAQYVTALQQGPEDQMLRERIIRLERTLTPSPAVPADAMRLFVKATIFQQEATDIRAHDPLAMTARDLAISAYRQALLIAPWWPEAYYGLSTTLEESGRFDEAVAALNLYIATGPNSAGSSAAQDKLRAIAVKRDQVFVKP